MGTKAWLVRLQGRDQRFVASHRYWTGHVTLVVDGKRVIDASPGFAGYADQAFRPTEYSATYEGADVTLRVTPKGTYQLNLFIDGRSADDRSPMSPIPRAPADRFFHAGQIGASVTFVALAYVLVAPWLFGSHSYEWGPRWFAANDLVLDAGLAVFTSGFGLYFVNVARLSPSTAFARVFWLLLGCAALFMGLSIIVAIPSQLADVVFDPITRNVHVAVSNMPKGDHAPTVTATSGETFEWQWAFGLYRYPELRPGDYELTLTPVSHQIVGARALGSAKD